MATYQGLRTGRMQLPDNPDECIGFIAALIAVPGSLLIAARLLSVRASLREKR
jgi:hypothetical protein